MTADDDESVATFVDYIPPPTPRPRPPAKYKLWLVVLVLVYFASWFSDLAGFVDALGASGWLSPTAANFVALGTVVFVLVFATLDLCVAVLTVNVRGRAYGLGPWLKRGRAEWLHRRKGNFFVECMSCAVAIFEDGFSMFDAPESLRAAAATTATGIAKGEQYNKQYDCPSDDCHVVLRIEHRIDANKLGQYRHWMQKIDKVASRRARGLLDMRKSEIEVEVVQQEDDVYDESNDGHGSDGQEHPNMGLLQTIQLTFEDIDCLNDWMTSRQRAKLIQQLEPLLAAPDIVRIQNSRVLPDAFTELLVRQGERVPSLTPKKWKVWVLTTLGLFFTRLWIGDAAPYYFSRWDMDDPSAGSERLRGFVTASLSTFVNSYIMTPLLLFLFSDWVRRKESESDENQPWKALNDGFESLIAKAVVTAALYGGFLIAYAVKSKT